MKSLGLVAVVSAAALFTAPVLAADPFSMDVSGSTSSWSGPYIGAQIGYEFDRAPSPDQDWENDPSGGLLGAFAGYNADLGGVVIGAELGANISNATGTVDTGSGDEVFTTTVDWDASLVGRLGLPVSEGVLLYGLGGVSAAQLTGLYEHTLSPDTPIATDVVGGLTAGVGLEFQIADGMAIRGEYRYAAYGPADLTCSYCGTTTQNLSTNELTVGLLARW